VEDAGNKVLLEHALSMHCLCNPEELPFSSQLLDQGVSEEFVVR
jgi:hypothetical protein